MKHFLLLLLLGTAATAPAIAQDTTPKKTLQQQMWEFAGYEEIPVLDEEECDRWIDDTKNGYLKFEGCSAPCGCDNGWVIGAYRKADGNYMFLSYGYDVCGQNYAMRTNESFEAILPPEMDLKYFYKQGAVIDTARAYYSIYIDIPHTGTETVLYFSPAPIGCGIAYSDKLQFEIPSNYVQRVCSDYYSECQHNLSTQYSNYAIREEIILSMKKLDLVNLTNEADKLRVLEQMMQAVKEGSRYQGKVPDSELDDYRECAEQVMDYLQAVYLESTKIAIRSVVMGWDRKAGRFYIKETNKHVLPAEDYNYKGKYSLQEYKNFLDFLDYAPLWVINC